MKNFFINLFGGYTPEDMNRVVTDYKKEISKLQEQKTELHRRLSYRPSKKHR